MMGYGMIDSPNIRVDMSVNGIKHGILQHIAEHNAELDQMLKQAVDHCLTTDNLQAKINQMAGDAFESAMRERLSRYFRVGEGAKLLDKAIHQALAEDA